MSGVSLLGTNPPRDSPLRLPKLEAANQQAKNLSVANSRHFFFALSTQVVLEKGSRNRLDLHPIAEDGNC